MQIHELNNFSGTLGSGAYLAIDDGNDTGKISSQGLLAATEARIDNIIAGPAPSAEEIVDARLGADGVTYPSLGDAIRDQITDVKSDITSITGNTSYSYTKDKSIGLSTPTTQAHETGWESVLVSCSEGDVFNVRGHGGNSTRLWVFSDANATVLTKSEASLHTNDYITITAPENAAYLACNSQYTSIKGSLISGDFLREQIHALKDDLKDDIKGTRSGFFDTNCAELVCLMGLTSQSVAGATFTPSDNGRVITANNSTNWSARYELINGSISGSVFEAGKTYRISYTGQAGAYLQVFINGSNVINAASPTGVKTFTLPNNTTTLRICLYIEQTVPAGEHRVSIVNEREMDYLEQLHNFSVDDFMYLTGNAGNILDGIGFTDGYYVNKNTGELAVLSFFSATDFFRVYPNTTYNFAYNSDGSQIAYYDFNGTYISGAVTSDEVTTPNNSNIYYARWCCETAHKSEAVVYVEFNSNKTKYINSTEGLLVGLMDAYANGITDVVVASGDYDIIAEYEAHFGSDYFTDYADAYNGRVNGNWDCGLWLDNIDVEFESGATVTANYTGNNSYVKQYFSAFAVGQNVTIDGLVLDASDLRYGIHLDFQTKDESRVEIKNSDLHHYKASSLNYGNQAIGAGLDVHSMWIIENCIFRADTTKPVVRIHNNVSASSKSKIIVKDCYIVGNGYFLFNSYSTSTEQTIVQVCGCSYATAPIVGKETEASNDNITMYAWNNELRS